MKCNIIKNPAVRQAMQHIGVLLFALTTLGGVAYGDFVLETGFEGSNSLPTGWTQSQILGSATWAIQQGRYTGANNLSLPNSGSNNATLFAANYSDNITRLISPAFDTDAYTTASLTFYHTQQSWGPDQDELKVFFSSDDGSNWTELAHYTNDVSTWTQRTLNLPTTSVNSRIAFEGNASYGYGINLDDIVVTGSPSLKSTFSITTTDAAASEVGPDPGTWTITRTGNTTGALSLNYTLSGNATVGSDYTVDTPSPISFAAGQTTAVVTLTPVDDTEGGEGDEVATLTLIEDSEYFVSGPSASISIYDDEGYDLNILVIGTNRSYSNERYSGISRNQQPFNPQLVVDELTSILNGDGTVGPANVQFENISNNSISRTISNPDGTFNMRPYSLLNYYYWPDGRTERLANLRGGNGTEWDYVIVLGDPSLIASTPGVYAKGVKLIVDTINEGTAQPMLMMQWPDASSSVPVADFGEVTYRVGDSGEIPVAPAGFAWNDLSSKDSGTHPTADGAYLAAATLYNKLFNRDAGTDSSYDYNDSLATLANNTVQTHNSQSHYSGPFNQENPHKRLDDKDRVIRGDHGAGTSTERGFLTTGTYNNNRYFNALLRPLLSVDSYSDNPSGFSGLTHFHIGRNNISSDPKRYRADPTTYRSAFAYSFQIRNQDSQDNNGGLDMLYIIDHMSTFRGDQRTAFDLINLNHVSKGVRVLPIHTLWAACKDELGTNDPFFDGNHYGADVNETAASYMMTLLTGRCPITRNGTETERTRQRIGYETAWIMSTLNLRPPGFRTLPSAHDAKTLSPDTDETMSVYFENPPQSEVTVNVSIVGATAAIASPRPLVFTPANHDTPQDVIVAGLPGASSLENFEVVFSTTSDDASFDGLSDAWAYTNNRSSTVAVSQVDNGTTQAFTAQYTTAAISLDVAGANAGNTTFAGPTHGSIIWSGSADIEYTPSGDYLGTDQIAYAATTDGTQTIGCIDITVQLPNGQVNATTNDAAASEEGPDSGTFVISRSGDTTDAVNVFFSMSGTATPGSDYTLSHTSPVTIPAGQSSVELTLTPIDDSVFGEEIESAILTIMEDAAYPIGIASATISIADNDNNAPVTNAGPDQSVILSGSAPWSPAQTTTQLWLDAADDTTITRSENLVSEWRDKSDNERHASQATSSSQPTWTSEGLNGKDVLTFDGSSDFLNLGTGLDFVAGASHSAFIVLADVTNYSNLYGAANASSGSSSLHVGFNNSNAYRMNYWSHDYGPNVTSNFQANGSILNYVWEVGSPKQILANGKPEGTGHNALSIGTMAGGGRIGNIVGQGFIGGKIGEIIFLTGTVAQTDRERMEGYLAHKWGLTGNLPSNHPYKNQAPGGSSVLANLDATVTDEDGQTPSSLWTKVSGPGLVLFGDASAVDTTATFSQTGTYILRLTADDGYAQTFDEVTITVAEPQSFANWVSGYDLGGQTAPQDDADGDGIPNAVENYFGTHPGTFNAGLAMVEVTINEAENTTFTFNHPMNATPATDLTAVYRWSKDLSSFHNDGDSDLNGTTVNFVAGTPVNGVAAVTATITGTTTDRIFVTVEVTQE